MAVNLFPGDPSQCEAAARAVTMNAGVVTGITGRLEAVDFAEQDILPRPDGTVRVLPRRLGSAYSDRAAAVELAMNAFIRIVSNTSTHESGHAVGLVEPGGLTIAGVRINGNLQGSAPGGVGNLQGGHTADAAGNLLHTPGDTMEAGVFPTFRDFIEDPGHPERVFRPEYLDYLRFILPKDQD